jgi:hypothetical protein
VAKKKKDVPVEEEVVKIQEGLRLEMPKEEIPKEEESVEDTPSEDVAEPEETPESDVTPEEEAESAEETPSEGEEEEPEEKVNENGKPYYTVEELKALNERGEDGKLINKVDTSRIDPESEFYSLYKALEAGYTPKLMEGAEYRKEVDALNKQVKTLAEQQQAAIQSQQPKTWEQAATADPVGTLNYAEQLLAQAEADDPFGEEAIKLRGVHRNLSNFIVSRQVETKQQSDYDTVAIQEIQAEVVKIAPDFYTDPAKYEAVAKEMGYSDEVLYDMTNAPKLKREGRTGEALGLLQSVLKYMDLKEQSKPKTPKEVVKKKAVTPTKVEDAGSGFDEPKEADWGASEAIEYAKKTRIA